MILTYYNKFGNTVRSLQFKFLVFMACIVQKLLYGLESAWINSAGQRKFDGFQARCLRKIFRIAPAHISRISNRFVLQQFAAIPLSKILLERQLLYFGHVARCHPASMLYKSVFNHDLILREPQLKQGRPRDTWGKKMLQFISQIFPDEVAIRSCIFDDHKWKLRIRSFCRS